jgi:hypothetical protein
LPPRFFLRLCQWFFSDDRYDDKNFAIEERVVNMSVHFGSAHIPPIHLHLHDALYVDSQDKQRHLFTIHAIAAEIARPIEEIAALYEEVLTSMKQHARVPDYLPVLVSKKVKQYYRQH